MTLPSLKVLEERFAVVRFAAHADIPQWAFKSNSFFSITKTDEEISITCAEKSIPSEILDDVSTIERPWVAIKILGPLDFGLIGILSHISSTLAKASVSIFAISTYDTDYVLVKEDKISEALPALRDDGYLISER
eukprot:Clim_evm7s229 gene=Clim_evmTU7s229